MKKCIWAIALLWLSFLGAKAQDVEDAVRKISVIPHVGVGFNKWSNCELSYGDGETVKAKYQTGFNGGVDVEYRATKEVAVSLGVNYARLGFKFPSYQTEEKGSDATTLEGYDNIHADMNYIQVPLKVRAYITRNLSLTLGVQAGFLCGDGKMKMNYTQATIGKNDEVTTKETETQTSDWPTKKYDVSIPIGLSYEYMGVILSAQYNLGLTNVSDVSKSKDEKGESYIRDNCKNRGFAVTVGYRFTL